MNCPHCGAPMKLYRSRDYYFCEYCASYHFPEQNDQGLRVLGENPEGLLCPHCRVLLNLVTFADFFRGYHCPHCQGLLFKRDTFREAIQFQRSRTKLPPEPFSTFDPGELEQKTYCPVCEGQMTTFQYNGPGNIVIDTCHPCDLIWLDYGEIQKVVNAPGKDRGQPLKPDREDSQEKPKHRDRPLLEQALEKFAQGLIRFD